MEFKHPKYYKELRKLRNNLDQVISKQQATASSERSPGPGLEVQIVYQDLTKLKPQAKKWKLNKFTMDEDVYVEDKS